MLYTVSEVAKICKTDVHRIYEFIKAGLLPALKLGSLKVRKESLDDFLEKYEGYDLTDIQNITKLDTTKL
ncbi:DNA-binding protein [bacterium D16-76]|nr:DNA-binding protein [bacterium D16-76]